MSTTSCYVADFTSMSPIHMPGRPGAATCRPCSCHPALLPCSLQNTGAWSLQECPESRHRKRCDNLLTACEHAWQFLLGVDKTIGSMSMDKSSLRNTKMHGLKCLMQTNCSENSPPTCTEFGFPSVISYWQHFNANKTP